MHTKNENIDIDAILRDVRFKEAHFARKEEICIAIIDYIEADKLKQQTRIFLTPKVILRNLAAAAVAIMIFMTGAYWILNTTVTTGSDAMAIVLPDNSDVMMQPNTTIKYNKLTWILKRDLSLEGCAEFKVVTGNTFTVNTALGDISVLGTRFMVDVNGEELIVECYEGSVSVRTKSGVQILTKDQKLHYDGEEMVPDMTWPEYVEFEDATLYDVFIKMEDIFNVVVEDKDKYKNFEFSGFIVPRDINETIELLSMICDLDFEYSNNRIKVK